MHLVYSDRLDLLRWLTHNVAVRQKWSQYHNASSENTTKPEWVKGNQTLTFIPSTFTCHMSRWQAYPVIGHLVRDTVRSALMSCDNSNVMTLHVLLELIERNGLSSTSRTREASLVLFLMTAEVAALSELVSANRASIWLLLRVDRHMPLPAHGPCECVQTDLAPESPLACVCLNVPKQG